MVAEIEVMIRVLNVQKHILLNCLIQLRDIGSNQSMAME